MLQKNLSRLFFTRSLVLLIVFFTFILYSCSLFTYKIENTTWEGTILYFDIIIEFQPDGISRLSYIDLSYNYLDGRNFGNYTFDPKSLTGTITQNNDSYTFTINDKTNTLTFTINGISINLKKLDAGYKWPNIDFVGNYYKYIYYDNSILTIHFYSSNCYVSNYDASNNSTSSSYYTYTWNDSNYTGYIYISDSAYRFSISFDEKYCIFDLDGYYPVYLELQ